MLASRSPRPARPGRASHLALSLRVLASVLLPPLAGGCTPTGAAGSGTGGTSGTGGDTAASACGAGPPSAPAGGANFPFPQHRASSNCIYPPTCTDADMMAGWAAYKTALIVADGTDGSMRVQRPS